MLKTIAPKSQLLQKYIESFYLFNSAIHGSISYLAFPHTNTGLSFFKGVSIERGSYRVKISEQKAAGDSVCIEVLGKYTRPVFVSYEGAIDEISVVFKPLGINRFIREDHSKIAGSYSQPYCCDDWLQNARDLFNSDNRIEAL